MNSDSRCLSDSWELFTDPAIHNSYHTSLYSVTISSAGIQMCSARHAEDKNLGLSLDTTDTCIVHKQTHKDFATTKTDLTDRRKTTKTQRHVSKRERTQPRQRLSMDKLDSTSRFVRVIPTLSQDCHITQWVTV